MEKAFFVRNDTVKNYELYHGIKPFLADSAELYEFICNCTADFERSNRLCKTYYPWVGMKAEITIHPAKPRNSGKYIIAIHYPNEERDIFSSLYPTVCEYHCDEDASRAIGQAPIFDPVFRSKWVF